MSARCELLALRPVITMPIEQCNAAAHAWQGFTATVVAICPACMPMRLTKLGAGSPPRFIMVFLGGGGGESGLLFGLS